MSAGEWRIRELGIDEDDAASMRPRHVCRGMREIGAGVSTTTASLQ